MMTRLLSGDLLSDARADQPGDRERFLQWTQDVRGELRAAAELEVRARLLRFLHGLPARARRSVGAGHARDAGLFERLAQRLHAHYLEARPLESLWKEAAVSLDHATAVFRAQAGMTPVEYRARLRVAHAQRVLLLTDASITDVAFQSGFGSVARLHAAFKRFTGSTPLRYCRQAQG
jgi:transcriptional regulator GlxA family with amidase domain